MKDSKPTHVALLRGINVGGKKKIAMCELRRCFGDLGFTEVTTLLNSGNVLFSSRRSKEADLAQTIERGIEKQFRMAVSVIVRSIDEIKAVIALDPFAKISVAENTRIYITFLTSKQALAINVKLPPCPPDLEILPGTDREGFSVQTIRSDKSIDAFRYIDRFYGKMSTTRSWATVCRMIKN